MRGTSPLSPLLLLHISIPQFSIAAAFFFRRTMLKLKYGSRFVLFCLNLSKWLPLLRRPFSLISLWIVYKMSPCSVLQALHKISDYVYHRISSVGSKRPLAWSLTYALSIYIGISTIGSCSILQNTSVKNVETSCKKAPVFTTHASPSWFILHHRRLSEEMAASTRQALCCCTHSFVANHTKP
jgi:hypothetical protein